MPTFLWSGKNAAGVEEADRVTADTPEASRTVLEERGWTELRLHTTEIHDFVSLDRRASGASRGLSKMTPKEELALRTGTGPGFWTQWSKLLAESVGLALVIAILLAWSILRGNTTGKYISAGLFLVLLYFFFLYPVLRWWFRQASREFRRLHRARNWHRWAEVLDCLDRVERAQRKTKIGIGDASHARYRALAMAGMGRLDEGLEILRVASEKAKTPDWLYHVFQAGLYRVVKQNEKSLELYRQALEEATDKSIVLIDLAAFLVEHYNRPAEARELLAEAEKVQLSELARKYVPMVRGKIAYREKDYAAADKLIRGALGDFQKHPRGKYYLYEASILTAKSYLAACNAALGNKAEARRFFKETEPYMQAVGMEELRNSYLEFVKQKA